MDPCEALAMNRGVEIGERRSADTGPSAYRQFMVACLAGQVEGKPVVAARIAPAVQIPGKWDTCERLALQRGDSVNERRSAESGPSPFRQFMKSCLAERYSGGMAVQTGGPPRGTTVSSPMRKVGSATARAPS